MAETAFERFGLALEATAGVAVTPPTHYLPAVAVLNPVQEYYRPVEQRGTRALNYRSALVRERSEWTMPATGADTAHLPLLLNMGVASVVAPTTPTNGILTRLWSFVRGASTATEKTATLYWGDPNIQIFQATHGYLQSLTITSDATGTDAVTMEASGGAFMPSKVSNPTWPSQIIAPLVIPSKSQVWIDTASAIGTTAIAGRVIRSSFTIDTLRGEGKYAFAGPTSGMNPVRFGVSRMAATATLAIELLDAAQYDVAVAGTVAKVRVRHNGDLIEAVTPSYYHYVEWDIYGPLEIQPWAEAYSSNRILEVSITSQVDATAGHDWAVRVQNNRTEL